MPLLAQRVCCLLAGIALAATAIAPGSALAAPAQGTPPPPPKTTPQRKSRFFAGNGKARLKVQERRVQWRRRPAPASTTPATAPSAAGTHTDPKKIQGPFAFRRAGDPQIPLCSMPGEPVCPTGDEKLPSAPPSQQPAPAKVDPQVIIQEAVATLELELPAVDPKVGPDPSLNRWNIVPVNLPIWLWLDEPDALTKSVNQQGIEIDMVARRTRVVFDMGNGDKVKCTRMSRWRKPLSDAELNRPSPNCGYRYRKLPKQEGAGFMMNVTVEWTVTWSALGQTGTVPLTMTGSRHMPVGELQTVIVPNRTPSPQPS